MRNALLAIILVLAMPAVAQAGPRSGFFFSFGSGYSSHHRAYYVPAGRFYSSYGYGGHYHKPYYGSGFHGRYAVPQVYSPYRYGDYRSDYYRNYAYRRSYDRGDSHNYDRGYYYGPAVERYHRYSRDYPSYHYDRREHYNRGRDYSYRDRGDRYR